MKYIILCGGVYPQWRRPRQLLEINNQPIIQRTVRLLRQNNIKDIAISTSKDTFEKYFNKFCDQRIEHQNTFVAGQCGKWVEAFPKMEESVCYIFGDVVFSDNAIKTIVNTHTDDIEFFASAPPFDKHYIKYWAEPFAFKVVNNEHFNTSIEIVKNHYDRFNREPIAWELWQVIKGTPLNKINYHNYTVINDITCDIDNEEDLGVLQKEWDKWLSI